MVFLSLSLSACQKPSPGVQDTAEPAQSYIRVSPHDFAVEPCAESDGPTRCFLVSAGGKVLLVNAPDGIGHRMIKNGFVSPDLLIITSLEPDHLSGIMGLRYTSWQAGRATPLPMVGPEGLEAFAANLDRGLVAVDALLYASKATPGGYDAAVLAASDVVFGSVERVFDTGDLTVDARAIGLSGVAYMIAYGGKTLHLMPCGVDLPEEHGRMADLVLSCAENGYSFQWPDAATGRILIYDGGVER